jgi:hypothetical protein
MNEIKNNEDVYTEDKHRQADGLMCRLLKSMGYEDGVEVYYSIDKWHC